MVVKYHMLSCIVLSPPTNSGSQNVISEPELWHYLGSWVEIQKLGTQAKLTEYKTLALGPSNMCLMRTSIDSEIHSYKAHY